MSATLHVIPVPSMLTIEEAFDEIAANDGLLPEHIERRPGWGIVRVHEDGTKEVVPV